MHRQEAARLASDARLTSRARAVLIVRRLIAIALVGLGLWGSYQQPLWPTELLAIGVLAVIAGLLASWSWLIIVPAALPLLDVSPYTGRLFLTEYDCLLLICLGMTYWHASSRTEYGDHAFAGRVLIALLGVSYTVSTLLFFEPPQPLTANSTFHFYSQYNALRVAKGFFWAWLFVPALRSELRSRPDALRLLCIGIAIGTMGAGLMVAWEQGVGLSLLDALPQWLTAPTTPVDPAHLIARVVAHLHVDGTVLSAFLVIGASSALALVIFGRRLVFEILGLVALICALMAIVLSASPTLYLASLIAGLTFLIAISTTIHRHLPGLAGSLIATGLISTITLVAFWLGGTPTALGVGLTIIVVAIAGTLYRRVGWLAIVIAIAAMIGSSAWVALSLQAIDTTTRISLPTTQVTLIAIVSAATPAWMVGRLIGRLHHPLQAILPLLTMLLVWSAFIHFGERYLRGQDTMISAIGENLSARRSHWRDILTMRNRDLIGSVFGNGVGSFPTTYYWYSPSAESLIDLRLVDTASGERHLALGAGDFGLAQRVNIEPHGTYTFNASIRSSNDTSLDVRLCPRHLLVSATNAPDCQDITLGAVGNDQWQTLQAPIDTGAIDLDPRLERPASLFITNSTLGTAIEIRTISLTDASGRELLRNRDFSANSDHWVFYNDYQHRAWHTQNLFVHLLIEHGWFGVVVFTVALVSALARALRATATERLTGTALSASLMGIATLGLFTSVIDTPRVATLFYLLMFTALTVPIAARRSPRDDRR